MIPIPSATLRIARQTVNATVGKVSAFKTLQNMVGLLTSGHQPELTQADVGCHNTNHAGLQHTSDDRGKM
jgi:hypothetical protein